MAMTKSEVSKLYDKGIDDIYRVIVELEKKAVNKEKPKAHSVAHAAVSSELDITLPSIRRLQQTIREQQEVEIKLQTEDTIRGKVLWLDNYCLCIQDTQSAEVFVIWQNAIAFVKAI